MTQPTGRPRRPWFSYTLSSPYGTCRITGNPTQVLKPDEISVALGQLGADIIDRSPDGYVLDIGTGSGILLASVVMHSRNPNRLRPVGTDIDPRARSCARRNIGRAIRTRRSRIPATIQAGHLVDPVLTRGQRFDLILANLPYLPEGEAVRAEAATAPAHALYSGSDGLDLLRELVPVLPDILTPGGVAIIRTPQEIDRMAGTQAEIESMNLAAAIVDNAEVAHEALYDLVRLAEWAQLTEADVLAAEAAIRQASSRRLRTVPVMVNRWLTSSQAPVRVGAGIAVMHANVPTHWERLPVQA
jgi:tRNA1(Val) A37 N6-methylase TrmN6